MKKLFFLLILLSACGSGSHTSTTQDITLLLDKTDSLTVAPNREAFHASFNLTKNPWQGITVTIADMTDLTITAESAVALPEENSLTGNTMLREIKAKHFEKRFDSVLTGMEQGISERKHSLLYKSIASHLNRLADSKAGRRQCFIYSDLVEHDDSLNFYGAGTLTLMRNHPEDIARKLQDEIPLGNLTGIEVYLIYMPRNYEDGKCYCTIASFYTELLKHQGATVHIGTPLNQAQL